MLKLPIASGISTSQLSAESIFIVAPVGRSVRPEVPIAEVPCGEKERRSRGAALQGARGPVLQPALGPAGKETKASLSNSLNSSKTHVAAKLEQPGGCFSTPGQGCFLAQRRRGQKNRVSLFWMSLR